MSFDTEKKIAGRRPISIVEMDLDFCTLTYGVAPCTASGPIGSECYNTRETTQDAPNYTPGTKTYTFVEDLPGLPRGMNWFPCLVDVVIKSARITPSEGLGARATVQITLQDFSDTDQFTDKYVSTRPYIPINQGTFFGKLKARNPFYVGRKIRVKTGYLTTPFDASNFQTRLYIIEKIIGPDKGGRVTITGRDVLVDTQKFTAPVVSKGKLLASLSLAEVGSFELASNGTDYPVANGTVRIDREIIQYATRVGNIFSSLTRGVGGTVAAAHSIDAGVQLCLPYTDVNVVDILTDLLTNYAGINPIYIPTTEWNDEKNLWLSSFNLTTFITAPTKVSTLISELTEQCLLDIWFDDLSQTIKLKAFAPAQGNTPIHTVDDNQIVARSLSTEDLAEKRLTQVTVYFGVINYAEDLNQEHNYTNILTRIDTDAESVQQFNDERIRKIFSRWFPTGGTGLANRLGGRLLSRFRRTPLRITYNVDMKDNQLKIGEFALLSSDKIQDPDGAPREQDTQIIEVQEVDAAHMLQITALNSGFDNLYAFIGPGGLQDFTLESSTNKRKYMFICGPDGKMSDGSPGYLIL